MRKLFAGIGISLLALVLLIGLSSPSVAQSVSRFGTVIAQRITALNGLTVTAGGATVTAGNLTATAGDIIATAGSVTAGNDLAATDDLTVGDDARVGGFIGATPQSTVTVVYQGVITPTGSLVYITAAAARGTRLVLTTTATTGDVIRVVNVGAQTITLTDTAPLVLTANFAMGNKDTLTLYYDGDEWVELARANN